MRDVGFTVIIADESHYIKSQSAKRTQTTVPLLQAARRVILLTGTPALSRPIELFSQLNALDSRLFSSAMAFGLRYCTGFHGGFGWDFTGSSNLSELYTILAHSLLIRRLKKDVLDQMPAKVPVCSCVHDRVYMPVCTCPCQTGWVGGEETDAPNLTSLPHSPWRM